MRWIRHGVRNNRMLPMWSQQGATPLDQGRHVDVRVAGTHIGGQLYSNISYNI